MLKHVSHFRQKEGTNQKLGATGGLLLYLPRSKHTSDNKTPISNKIPNIHYFVRTLTKQLKVDPHNNAVLCGHCRFHPPYSSTPRGDQKPNDVLPQPEFNCTNICEKLTFRKRVVQEHDVSKAVDRDTFRSYVVVCMQSRFVSTSIL